MMPACIPTFVFTSGFCSEAGLVAMFIPFPPSAKMLQAICGAQLGRETLYGELGNGFVDKLRNVCCVLGDIEKPYLVQ